MRWLARALAPLVLYGKKGLNDMHSGGALAAGAAYGRTLTRSAERAGLFSGYLHDDLPDEVVAAPVMHSRRGTIVDPAAMSRVHERLRRRDKQMVWVEEWPSCQHGEL